MKKPGLFSGHFFLIVLIGMIAIITQITFLRLAAVAFNGNELTMCLVLGHWLLWTGMGSMWGGRIAQRIKIQKTLPLLISVYFLAVFIGAYIFLLIRRIAGISISEIIGVLPTFVFSFAILVIPAFLNGMLFPFFVRWILDYTRSSAVHFVYIAEVSGGVIGSLVFALMIKIGLSTLLVLEIFVVLVLVIFFISQNTKHWGRIILLTGVSLIAVMLIFSFNQKILILKWYPFKVLKTHETPHYSLSLLQFAEVKTLYADSEPLWTLGDQEAAEELVHFALINHDAPENILIVGIANPDIFAEISKYKTVKKVTVLQSENSLNKILDDISEIKISDYQVIREVQDPLVYFRQTHQKFDVILMNTPQPINAQWNRIYTLELFRLLTDNLTDSGLVQQNFNCSETYLSTENFNFFKTIQNTAQAVFPEFCWIPGNFSHLLFSSVPLTNQLDVINHRFLSRGISNQYICDYFLVDRLAPQKIQFLQDGINCRKIQIVNSLIRPIGYYYNTVLWARQTGNWVANLYRYFQKIEFQKVLILFMAFYLVLLVLLRIRHKSTTFIQFNMCCFGFLIMGLESTVIILFQSYVGGLYLRIVFITCAFMLGAAAGALIELKSYQTGQQKPVFRQMLILGICLLAVFGIIALQPIQFLTSAIILTVLFLAGILSGTVFPRLVCLLEQAKQIQLTKSAGNIYAWDILGACLGIYLFSGLIIPIFGLLSAIIILSLICAGLIIVNFHIR